MAERSRTEKKLFACLSLVRGCSCGKQASLRMPSNYFSRCQLAQKLTHERNRRFQFIHNALMQSRKEADKVGDTLVTPP